MRVVWCCWIGALVVACGARSGIAGGAAGFLDATADVGASDAGPMVDGSVHDAAIDAGACTVTTVKAICAGPNGGDCDKYGCKFNVEWTCGDVKFRAGGACEPPDAGGFYQGVCDENGGQTSTFDITTTTCDCKESDALATLVQGLCTHQ